MREPNPTLVNAALHAANQSTCRKSQRGVAILPAAGALSSIVFESNGPPAPFVCDGSKRCVGFCRRLAVHAEQRALLSMGRYLCEGAELVHVKTVKALPVPSGEPSCVECSKLILDARVGLVWLLRSVGWRAYTAEEFHALSLEHHNLPRIT